MSSLVPIPKNKRGNKCDSDIDRLPSVVSWKSYLIVLYWKNNKIIYLLIYYNLVFKKAFTVVCTSLLKETIDYYNENNTDCY